MAPVWALVEQLGRLGVKARLPPAPCERIENKNTFVPKGSWTVDEEHVQFPTTTHGMSSIESKHDIHVVDLYTLDLPPPRMPVANKGSS